MAGRTSRYKREEMEATYIENLRFAAERLSKVCSPSKQVIEVDMRSFFICCVRQNMDLQTYAGNEASVQPAILSTSYSLTYQQTCSSQI